MAEQHSPPASLLADVIVNVHFIVQNVPIGQRCHLDWCTGSGVSGRLQKQAADRFGTINYAAFSVMAFVSSVAIAQSQPENATAMNALESPIRVSLWGTTAKVLTGHEETCMGSCTVNIAEKMQIFSKGYLDRVKESKILQFASLGKGMQLKSELEIEAVRCKYQEAWYVVNDGQWVQANDWEANVPITEYMQQNAAYINRGAIYQNFMGPTGDQFYDVDSSAHNANQGYAENYYSNGGGNYGSSNYNNYSDVQSNNYSSAVNEPFDADPHASPSMSANRAASTSGGAQDKQLDRYLGVVSNARTQRKHFFSKKGRKENTALNPAEANSSFARATQNEEIPTGLFVIYLDERKKTLSLQIHGHKNVREGAKWVLERMTFATPLSGCGFYDIDGSELSPDVILNDIPSRSMVVKEKKEVRWNLDCVDTRIVRRQDPSPPLNNPYPLPTQADNEDFLYQDYNEEEHYFDPTSSLGLLRELEAADDDRYSSLRSATGNGAETDQNLLIGVLTEIAADEETDRVDMFESILESGLGAIRESVMQSERDRENAKRRSVEAESLFLSELKHSIIEKRRSQQAQQMGFYNNALPPNAASNPNLHAKRQMAPPKSPIVIMSANPNMSGGPNANGGAGSNPSNSGSLSGGYLVPGGISSQSANSANNSNQTRKFPSSANTSNTNSPRSLSPAPPYNSNPHSHSAINSSSGTASNPNAHHQSGGPVIRHNASFGGSTGVQPIIVRRDGTGSSSVSTPQQQQGNNANQTTTTGGGNSHSSQPRVRPTNATSYCPPVQKGLVNQPPPQATTAPVSPSPLPSNQPGTTSNPNNSAGRVVRAVPARHQQQQQAQSPPQTANPNANTNDSPGLQQLQQELLQQQQKLLQLQQNRAMQQQNQGQQNQGQQGANVKGRVSGGANPNTVNSAPMKQQQQHGNQYQANPSHAQPQYNNFGNPNQPQQQANGNTVRSLSPPPDPNQHSPNPAHRVRKKSFSGNSVAMFQGSGSPLSNSAGSTFGARQQQQQQQPDRQAQGQSTSPTQGYGMNNAATPQQQQYNAPVQALELNLQNNSNQLPTIQPLPQQNNNNLRSPLSPRVRQPLTNSANNAIPSPSQQSANTLSALPQKVQQRKTSGHAPSQQPSSFQPYNNNTTSQQQASHASATTQQTSPTTNSPTTMGLAPHSHHPAPTRSISGPIVHSAVHHNFKQQTQNQSDPNLDAVTNSSSQYQQPPPTTIIRKVSAKNVEHGVIVHSQQSSEAGGSSHNLNPSPHNLNPSPHPPQVMRRISGKNANIRNDYNQQQSHSQNHNQSGGYSTSDPQDYLPSNDGMPQQPHVLVRKPSQQKNVVIPSNNNNPPMNSQPWNNQSPPNEYADQPLEGRASGSNSPPLANSQPMGRKPSAKNVLVNAISHAAVQPSVTPPTNMPSFKDLLSNERERANSPARVRNVSGNRNASAIQNNSKTSPTKISEPLQLSSSASSDTDAPFISIRIDVNLLQFNNNVSDALPAPFPLIRSSQEKEQMERLQREKEERASQSVSASPTSPTESDLLERKSYFAADDLPALQRLSRVKQCDVMREYPHIAKGMYGIVYKAKVPSIADQTIVVKDLTIENARSIEEWKREIIVMSTITSPYVVKVYGFCEEESMLSILMEFVPNGDLFKMLHRRKDQPLSWLQKIRMAHHCAKGLSCLHHHNIIHRDVKSMNILLTNDFSCKITDFGCSKVLGESSSHLHTEKNIGTPLYLAPELRTGIYSYPADVYSLGIVLYEIFEREVPQYDMMRQHINLPTQFFASNIVLPLLNPIPDQRPTSHHCIRVLDRVLIKVLNALQMLLSAEEIEEVKSTEETIHLTNSFRPSVTEVDESLVPIYKYFLTRPQPFVDELVMKSFQLSSNPRPQYLNPTASNQIPRSKQSAPMQPGSDEPLIDVHFQPFSLQHHQPSATVVECDEERGRPREIDDRHVRDQPEIEADHSSLATPTSSQPAVIVNSERYTMLLNCIVNLVNLILKNVHFLLETKKPPLFEQLLQNLKQLVTFRSEVKELREERALAADLVNFDALIVFLHLINEDCVGLLKFYSEHVFSARARASRNSAGNPIGGGGTSSDALAPLGVDGINLGLRKKKELITTTILKFNNIFQAGVS